MRSVTLQGTVGWFGTAVGVVCMGSGFVYGVTSPMVWVFSSVAIVMGVANVLAAGR